MSLKFLVFGDIKGKLDEVYKKVSIIEKKSGKFDILFCIGDTFGEDVSFLNDYMEQKKTSSIETFIISPLPESLKTVIDEKGSEICKNIIYLGNKGTMKFQNKLKVAYLSSDNVTSNDIKEITHELMCTNMSYSGIDILFTNLWPSGIENGSHCLPGNQASSEWGSDLISVLTALVQPRYHFTSGKDIYYERQPYRNQTSNLSKPKHCTRFIALSSFKNKNNDRFSYAFQLVPMEIMPPADLLQIPANCTDNPFSSVKVDSVLSTSNQQFFYDTKNLKRKNENEPTSTGEKKTRNTRDGCWFCLGNPEVEKHLVVHIGKEVYTAMPRGPLTEDHMMILTVGHFQSFVTTPKEVAKEIRKTMKNISSYFSSQGKSVVFFERNFKTNHFGMQAIPLDSDRLEVCKSLFLQLASESYGPGENFREVPGRTKLEEVVKPNVPYLYVQFSDGTKLLGAIPQTHFSSFDIQFGRVVMSNPELLNCPEKIQWRDHTEDFDSEVKMVRNLKKAFSGIL